MPQAAQCDLLPGVQKVHRGQEQHRREDGQGRVWLRRRRGEGGQDHTHRVQRGHECLVTKIIPVIKPSSSIKPKIITAYIDP